MATKAKSSSRAVLFVLIGWTKHYDGTEIVEGDHKFLTKHPRDNAEARAFICQEDGFYRCGAGNGEIREDSLDVVFVARDPQSQYRVVAIYKDAAVSLHKEWATVESNDVVTYGINKRPLCVWPVGRGMRRWARRLKVNGRTHPSLLDRYGGLHRGSSKKSYPSELDPELSAFEGEQRRRFLLHRKREAKLRKAKIAQVWKERNGKLKCEVPGCGFDFHKTYGAIGYQYAVVHHLQPLAAAPIKGIKSTLKDLAVVCANCHVMIHRGGECRPLDALISGRSAP